MSVPSANRPTLHVTNWHSSTLHGPGRAFTVAPRPVAWERGRGRVSVLSVQTPAEFKLLGRVEEAREAVGDLSPIHATVRDLRRALEARWALLLAEGALAPGKLGAPTADPDVLMSLQDGDTVCCSCTVIDALCGLCLRWWFAPFLVRAGWKVVRDGQEVEL